MSRLRATGIAALTALLSLVAALFVGVVPAHATDVDKTIGYQCATQYGSGASDVRIRVTLPDQVHRGVAVSGRRVRFNIHVPRAMVAELRQYGVTSLSATGRAHYRIGTLKRPIRHLHIPQTDVPSSGGMTLRGSGRAAGFTMEQTGTYLVKVTKSLTATATAYGGLAGGGASVPMTCSVRPGESRVLASLRVVA